MPNWLPNPRSPSIYMSSWWLLDRWTSILIAGLLRLSKMALTNRHRRTKMDWELLSRIPVIPTQHFWAIRWFTAQKRKSGAVLHLLALVIKSTTTLRACYLLCNIRFYFVGCEPPEEVNKAIVMGNNYGLNHSIQYSCEPGYKLDGASRRTCYYPGEWSERSPVCQG